jgi:hypothetical protein
MGKTTVKLAPWILAADSPCLGEQAAGSAIFIHRDAVITAMKRLRAARGQVGTR